MGEVMAWCKCRFCGAVFEVRAVELRRPNRGLYCSHKCASIAKGLVSGQRSAKIARDSFWPKLHAAPNGCLEYTGPRNSKGYGYVTRNNRSQTAHRYAWQMANGPIPRGMHVLHRCDNRACCNPAHLWLGTHAENMADMAAKGRSNTAAAIRASANKRRIITPEFVERVARMPIGMSQTAMAAKLGVSYMTIARALNGDNR